MNQEETLRRRMAELLLAIKNKEGKERDNYLALFGEAHSAWVSLQSNTQIKKKTHRRAAIALTKAKKANEAS